MAYDRRARGRAYIQKTRVELAWLEEQGVKTAGNAFSSVLLAKGEPGPAELAGGDLLSGADGKALRAALLKLGYAPEDWAGVEVSPSMTADLFRRAVATFDPATLVLLDESAARVTRDAYADDLVVLADLQDALLSPGRVVQVAGMRMINLGGFEAALASEKSKQLVWAYLKQIPPLGEPY